MKKVLWAVLLLMLSVNVFSQEEFAKSKFTVGVKGGLNISDKFDDEPWGSKLRFRMGANVDYSVGEFVFFRTGATYSQKGSTYNNTGKKLSYDLDYLTIPLGLGVFIPIDNGVNISLIFSGYSDIGVSIKSQLKEDNVEVYSSSSWDASGMKRMDFGISAELELSYKQALLCIGYDRGYRNISTGGEYSNLFNKWNNNCLYVSLGYKFLIVR
ncbi:MAG: porin family protein [Dysgonomonas sp.]|nr:porin family protein [Dysgonomonas sp.]